MKAVAAVLLLCVCASAQAPWLCRDDVKASLRRIREQTDKSGLEYAFRVDPDSVQQSEAADRDESHVRITFTRGKTLAIVHTHPADMLQTPSPADRALARKSGVAIVVLGVRSQEIVAAMPDGAVTWLSYFWGDNPSSCK